MPKSFEQRRFLFLQGPHGPFFWQLGRTLRALGAQTMRVGFNPGDRAFWPGPGYLRFKEDPGQWPARIASLLDEGRITDLVLYGDTRPIHAQAIQAARASGVTIHVFEEGYLRPYWVTYERGGSNGHSPLMALPLAEIARRMDGPAAHAPEVPPVWGDMRQHVFWGALYHFVVLTLGWRYPRFRPHRGITVAGEARLYLRKLMLLPLHRWQRMLATRRVLHGGFPFHLALLQLEHDASFQAHSPFNSMGEFLDVVIDGFAKGAPRHHHLVFKAHPLEDGRAPIAADIARLARARGIQDRVHFLRGGKLAVLLDLARSIVTVNSTAGQQALWRGLPLRIFGAAVYDKPEFVSSQPLAEFFAAPRAPDTAAYQVYRAFLLQTSQIAGGFYSAAGRKRLLLGVLDALLSEAGPYDRLQNASAAQGQQLRLVI